MPAIPTQRPTARTQVETTNASTSFAEDILSKAQSGRPVIQDFCPLAESLEWQLGQEYLRSRGNKAFISDASPVPFIVNNDGTLSHNAAEVFFASLCESQAQGSLAADEDIFVLELGIGVGLFARYFLDAMRELCDRHGKDFYDRLCYVAADRSERMLSDLLRHGVLSQHPGRYCVRQVDAMRPEDWLTTDMLFRGRSQKPLRAVFLNYLLDCLPAAVLDLSEESIRQLHVRTCVARSVQLANHTDLSQEQLAQRAKTLDESARADLLEVYGLFASEYDYRPVELASLPLGEFALSYGRGRTRRLLHSYGAIASLEKLLAAVADDGFVLFNDYGSTQADAQHFEHQRFSLATFVGVNFAQLEEYFVHGRHYALEAPYGQEGGLHSRLLARQLSPTVRFSFQDCFGQTRRLHQQQPLAEARQWLQVGRSELAATQYREAVRRQPYNWVLLNEVAMFLIFSLRDIKAGIDMAKLALAQNPSCSADLWNTLGDGLFEFGRLEEARSAYHKALAVNESDVRARYNLAWVYMRERNCGAALEIIAQGLTLDKSGVFRERLLAKQQEVVALQAALHQQEYLLLANLVSKYTPANTVEPAKDNTP